MRPFSFRHKSNCGPDMSIHISKLTAVSSATLPVTIIELRITSKYAHGTIATARPKCFVHIYPSAVNAYALSPCCTVP